MKELLNISAEVRNAHSGAVCNQEGIAIVNAAADAPIIIYAGQQKNAARLTNFYAEIAAQYLRFAKKEMAKAARKEYVRAVCAGEKVIPFSAVQSYRVCYNRGLISIFYEQYEYVGGAHGGTLRFADTYLLEEGRFVALSELFLAGSGWKKRLRANILAQIESRTAQGYGFYYEKHKRLVNRFFSAKNFYLTDNGIVLYFGEYEIAPYSAGIPEFLVPYSELVDILAVRLGDGG